jgi:hypothetical protein
LLYLTCDAGQKKLGTTGIATMEDKEWCIWQGIRGVKKIQKKMLSKDNELPSTTYKAK